MSEIRYVFPVNDLVDHDTDGGDCVCGPTVEPVERDDGSMGFLVSHHSRDGREHIEPGHDRSECPGCCAEHGSDDQHGD